MKTNDSILFLINTLNGGGAEKVLVNLANGLTQRGFEVAIQTLSGGVNEQSLDATVRFRTLVKGNLTFFKDYFVRAFNKLLPYNVQAKILLRGDYAVKVAYLEGYPTKILSYDKSGARRLAYVHSDLSKGYTLGRLYPSKQHCLEEYAGFDGVAFVSQVAKDGFFSAIGFLNNSSVIYNVMDVNDILAKSEKEPKYHYSEGVIKLISVGRLSAPKSFDRLINVVHRLNEHGLKIELFILGTGELETELKAQAQRLRCDNVSFLGYTPNPYPYMAMADMMICSSLYEGYSTTTVEAMLLGLPVITTECAGMDEILDGGKYGIIVRNTESDLYEGLFGLLNSPDTLLELKRRVQERSRQLKNITNLNQNIQFLSNEYDTKS